MADGARAEDVQHPLGPGGEMRRLGCERTGRSLGLGWGSGFGGEQAVLGKQGSERNPAHTGGQVGEEATAVEEVAGEEVVSTETHGIRSHDQY